MSEQQARMKWSRGIRAMFEGQHWMFLKDGATIYVGNLASHQTYDVTREGCTCPDHQARCEPAGVRCKHWIATWLYRDKIERIDAR